MDRSDYSMTSGGTASLFICDKDGGLKIQEKKKRERENNHVKLLLVFFFRICPYQWL